jgi:DNA-binding MarR family transcriptional regulator
VTNLSSRSATTRPSSTRSATTPADASLFPASFLENISFVVNKVAERINQEVELVTLPHGLTRRQNGMLILLQEEGPQAQILLSQRVGLDPTNIMRIVDFLEKQGFVQRHPDPNDRRKHSVAITEAGSEHLAQTLPKIRATLAEITGALSDQEQAQLLGLLKRMLEFGNEI